MSNKKIENKRIKSTRKYFADLQERHSKLNIVRVDLGYSKEYSKNTKLKDANKDLDKMFNNMRSKPTIFKDKVGHVVKREYTEDKGVHIHAIFAFDGQKVQKDKLKAKQIGEYWSNEITKNKGSYHNCNMNKYKVNGVGMIDHRDSEKRKVLDEVVIPYLCKDEQKVDAVKSNTKDRSLTRGTIPKGKKKIGRPRNKKELIKDETKS